jgi:hypothetical protein
MRQIGIDPGSVNFGVGDVRFDGFRYDPTTQEETPLFTPLHMELWNLKTGTCIRNSRVDGGPFELYTIPSAPTYPKTEIGDWTASLNHFIGASQWIFETPLPDVTVENQFDHIKSQGNKFDMFLISNVFGTSIHMTDLCNAASNGASMPLHSRLIEKSSSKYGMYQNGTHGRDHDGNKAECIQIMRSLLKLSGHHGWIQFLDSVLKSGQKIDDLCDALSLALQKAIAKHTKRQKEAKKKRPDEDAVMEANAKQANAKQAIGLRPVPYGNVNHKLFDNTTYPILLSSVRIDDDGNEFPDFPSYDEAEDTTKQASAKQADAKQDGAKQDKAKPKRKYTPRKKKDSDMDSTPPTKKRKTQPKKKKSDAEPIAKPKKKAATKRKRKEIEENSLTDEDPSPAKKLKMNPLEFIELDED